MSDSISSASQTVATQLTDLSKNITLNIRYLLILVFTLVIFMFYFSSLFSISLTASVHTGKCKKRGPLKYVKHYSPKQCSIAEGDFSSNEYFSNIDSEFKSPQFQSIPLTAPDSSSNHPVHLMFGQAEKYVTDNAFSIKINANLYVLDGNIFDIKPTNEKQSYNAYLIRKDNSKIKLGNLLKDGDGLYKLTFSSNKPSELDSYVFVAIYYNDKTPLLIGGFR
jgi:hypothetical protein